MSVEFTQVMHGLTGEKNPVNPIEKEDAELEGALVHIWDIAQEQFHLDPFPTHFEVVPSHVMYEVGSYALPQRFSHWTHGKMYQQQKTMYDYGLSKIYELVINSNPTQAFLLENNPPVENKFVMAHVLAHSDFFKNNHTFAKTRRDMPESASHNAARIEVYEEKEGTEKVEKFLDAVLAIQEHIDPYYLNRLSRNEELSQWREEANKIPRQTGMLSEFDDIFAFGKKPEEKPGIEIKRLQMPPSPDKDLLGFIRNHAPYLEDWERDVVDIIRSEMMYFWPQMQTKIMNEGWASYFHKRILREMADRKLLTPAENEQWWKLHSGVLHQAPGAPLNPYYLGMKMFEYIEDYHNGNLEDKEIKWLEDQDIPVYPKYTGEFKDSPGLSKIREVMMTNDDQSFIRNYFDKNIADRMGMYVYEKQEFDGDTYYYIKDKGWQEIRDKLVDSKTNAGIPYIVVTDGDYGHKRELYLQHRYEGKELDQKYLTKTLPYIYQLWRRPVHLETLIEDQVKMFTYDGKEIKITDL